MRYVLFFAIMVALLAASVFLAILAFKRGGNAKRIMAAQILSSFLLPIFCSIGAIPTFAQSPTASTASEVSSEAQATAEIKKTAANATQRTAETAESQENASSYSFSKAFATALCAIAMAIAIAAGCIGTGIAVGSTAPAAIGALTEEPKSFGKSMLLVAMGEGITIFAVLIAVLILVKMP